MCDDQWSSGKSGTLKLNNGQSKLIQTLINGNQNSNKVIINGVPSDLSLESYIDRMKRNELHGIITFGSEEIKF